MNSEIWKDIPGYEGLYSISTLGRIKSYPRECWNGTGFFILKERVMKQQDNQRGYMQIVLNSGKNPKIFYVHRLVLLTFVGEPGDLIVNHKNGIKNDNRLINLEYVTYTENSLHAWENNLIKEEQKKNFIEASKRKRSKETRTRMSIATKKVWDRRRGLL